MKKNPRFWWLLVCLAAGTSLFAADAERRVQFEDPTGDVKVRGDGGPGKDIVRLTIESDEEMLYVTMELKEEPAYYLNGHEASDIVEMHIDTDDDPKTGGIAFWGSEAGFEFAVLVQACIEYESGTACSGSMEGTPVKGYFTSYRVERHEEGKKQARRANDPDWESPRKTIQWSLPMVAIPYSELGVQPGQTIRVLVREADGPVRDSYFPIARVKLE